MKNLFSFLFILCLINSASYSQRVDLSYYLPDDVAYNKDIPTPEAVLGYQVGEWHASHDQLLFYMRTLANVSDRMVFTEHARTYENRPLVQVIVTSPDNHNNLDQIQAEHRKLSDPAQSASLDVSNMPAVVWLGYSVHGNEASGANASLLTAYYLAAAQGDKVDELLKNTVILLDPAFNPDGIQRFSTWVNSHKSSNLVTDPGSREFQEVWPRGRTNHYWFDLNRDWLPLQHPESRGRIQRFHEWKPNVLTDHHEMGTNNTFFFQPGVPSRNNPNTPPRTYELTAKMAEYHAKALDAIGSLYYTKESFDDYYYGKGSTYPDVNGCIGILFEQASTRGHAQESVHGVVTFPFAIRNHFTASLSTLAAAVDLRTELLEHQRTFYNEALDEAKKGAIKAYVFGMKDGARLYHFLDILKRHQINVYKLNKSYSTFNAEESYIVPLDQKQYRLAKGIFERRTSFQDSLFYDVSAWTLPLAFDIPIATLGSREFKTDLLGDEITSLSMPQGELIGGFSSYAYAFSPESYYAHRTIYRMQKAKIKLKVSTDDFTIGGQSMPRGTVIVPIGIQAEKKSIIDKIINEVMTQDGVDIYSLSTGLASDGLDLGSPSILSLKQPKVAVLVEGGVNSYEAGEVWHLLDQRIHMPVSLLPIGNLNRIDLDRYTTIVMVDGNYGSLSKSARSKLDDWTRSGGTIVSWKRGASWLHAQKMSKGAFEKGWKDTVGFKAYEDRVKYTGAQVTGGAIFNANIDTSHPLGYGMDNSQISLFRNHNFVMKKTNSPYSQPLRYTDQPLQSGYISKENLARLEGSPAVTISRHGQGKVIAFTDNPNFRAFWYGTNKLFLNSLFFASVISSASAE